MGKIYDYCKGNDVVCSIIRSVLGEIIGYDGKICDNCERNKKDCD